MPQMTPHDVVNIIQPLRVDDATAVTAGGAGDATEATSAAVDVAAATQGNRYNAMGLLLAVSATLAEAATLTVTLALEEAEDDGAGSPSDWQPAAPEAVDAPDSLTLTGGPGGSTERAVFKVGVDLRRVRRYLRVKYNPDLSAANTDTASLQPIWLLANPQMPPS